MNVCPGDFLRDALEARQRIMELATHLPVKITKPRHVRPLCIALEEEEIKKGNYHTNKEVDGEHKDGGETLNGGSKKGMECQ